jgi:hypothetical protein
MALTGTGVNCVDHVCILLPLREDGMIILFKVTYYAMEFMLSKWPEYQNVHHSKSLTFKFYLLF